VARFVKVRPAELIVSGGGVHNAFLMKSLRGYFGGTTICTSGEFGIDPDAKEAACFAYLACLTALGLPGNIPAATGAKRRAVLGTLAFPNNRS
jgi:anhydro-N-acetylmuramic acid kinase